MFARRSDPSRDRDGARKRALLDELSECVKDIQYSSRAQRDWSGVVCGGDSATALCEALEATLLHGVKESLLRRLAGPAHRRADCDFWPLVLVVSHRESVERICALSHVSGGVGRSRAWLRAALNDSLLSSYLATLQRDADAVRPFYSRLAFARDAEALDLARNLVEGLETCAQFCLPLNSSLLNEWPESVLLAAGLATAATRPAAICSAVDVADTLPDPRPRPPARPDLALDEDEALRFILSERSGPSDERAHDRVRFARLDAPRSPSEDAGVDLPSGGSEREESTNRIGEIRSDVGSNAGGESDLDEEDKTAYRPVERSDSPEATERESKGESPERTDLRDVMRDMRSLLSMDASTSTLGDRDVESISAPTEASGDAEAEDVGDGELIALIGRLARERGLDAQNYQCAGCQDSIGGGGARANVCAFTGEYYCDACTHPEALAIPARVVHNWDLGRYVVSRRAARFLLTAQHRPLLDLLALNPRAYAGSAALRAVRDARDRLAALREYADACRERERLGAEWRRMVRPRDYLATSTHVYSAADLLQVPTGQLQALLERVAGALSEHVRACRLCSQQGFVCELCRAPEPLFPFEREAVVRCAACGAVFHTACTRAAAPCPRCARRRARAAL